MIDQHFGPVKRGQVAFACVLGVAAGLVLYLGWVLIPTHPTPDRFYRRNDYALLFATILMGLAVASWRWKPYQAEINVSDQGIDFHASGRFPIARTQLGWKKIVRIEHRIQFRNTRCLILVAAQGAAKPERSFMIPAEALENGLVDVIIAIEAATAANGWRLVGPRPQHVGAWFDGMTWTLEPGASGDVQSNSALISSHTI